MATANYELRPFRDGDEPGLVDCFNRVFVPLGAKPRERAEVDWLLHGNPEGIRFWVATARAAGDASAGTEQVVGTYGAIPVRVDVGGEHVHFLHAIDSAIDPAHRAGLKRPGLFVELATKFYEACSQPDDHPLTYGIPTEEAWRIGRKLLDYELVRPLPVHVFPPLAGHEVPAEVERIERFDEQALWLYHRIAAHHHVALERNPAYLNWRYGDHPRHRYHRFGLRDDDGVLRALAIFRTADLLQQRLCVLVDWMCPPEDEAYAEPLMRAVQAVAAAEGASAVVSSVPEWSFWFERFQRLGGMLHPSPWFCVVRVKHKRFGTWPLRDGWWFQLGDTDNV